jgi:hypothetical protein
LKGEILKKTKEEVKFGFQKLNKMKGGILENGIG